MTLYIPDLYKEVRLLCFDPGLNTTGMSVFEVCGRTKQIRSIHSSTIYTERMRDYTGLDDEIVAERTLKLYKLLTTVQQALAFYSDKPLIVGCEAPFYNARMPMAFVSLSEVVNTFRNAVIQFNCNIPFIVVEPQLVKKGVGVAGKLGKEVVMDAVRGIPEIMGALVTPLETLDEHAIDAIAVGWSLLRFKL